jgi:hypothetical protein
VINRNIQCGYNPFPDLHKFDRIFARGLSSLTYNNGVGLGMCDVVTDRLVNQIDWNPTWINSLTASTPSAIRTPIHFATDRECLERIMPTVGELDMNNVTFGWIRNTMELSVLGLSENLKPEIEKNPMLEILGPPSQMEFDSSGDLVDLLVDQRQPAHAGH